jgi:hypothetical protein
MPFVFLWGWNTNPSLFSMRVASLGSVFAYRLFRLYDLSKKKAIWLVVLLSFGSMQWYHGVIGSAWYLSSMCALMFFWISLIVMKTKKPLFLLGIFLGLTYLCRYPAILSLPFFIINTSSRWFKNKQIRIKLLFMFGLGLFLCVGISFVYNFLRYGTIWHLGYQLLEKRFYNISNEYAEGSYSLGYYPRHLKAVFWSFPRRTSSFPYFSPNFHSMALWIVMPAVILAFWAPIKKKLVWSSWLVILIISMSHFFHGGIGATQFGYRYALDYFPFLFIIFAQAIKKNFYWWQKGLIILSIIINLWGVYFSFWR